MNDEIQVTNRDLLVACFFAIGEVFRDAGIRFDSRNGSDKWVVYVRGSENDILEPQTWIFEQSRLDPHMQQALVKAKHFADPDVGSFRIAKDETAKFNRIYDELLEAYPENFTDFLDRVREKFDRDNFEASTEWTSSSTYC